MPDSLILYHTSGCHLCEKARDLLWPFLSQYSLTLVECDIADSDGLIECYGAKIPVLQTSKGVELAWPFDATRLAEWLKQLEIQSE